MEIKRNGDFAGRIGNIYSLQKGYKKVTINLSSRDKLHKEVTWMFIFGGNLGCNTNNQGCNTIWQILSRICGFGC